MSFALANSRQVRSMIERAVLSNLVLMITSSPGMGKSALVKSVAEQYNLKLIDHRLSTSAPEDLTGLPFRRADGRAEFAPFADLFPLEGDELPIKQIIKKEGEEDQIIRYDGWLLFLDELNSASKSVMAAAYKLILDRQVGQKNLHERVAIVGAGNLMTDRAIVNNMGTALQSRVVHATMEVNQKVWLEDVALPQKWDSRVVAYLQTYPTKLSDFDPEHKDRTFCCPRTWDMVNKYLKTRPGPLDAADRLFISGTISAEEGNSFVQFTKVFDTMITVADVVRNPDTAKVPDDNPTRWAVVMAMVEGTNEANYDAIMTYIERFDMGYRVVYTRALMAQQPALRKHPRFAEACINITQYLTAP
ncbi:ATPase [Achromobacter phage vB_AxyP_19-32_Axy24]|uniref:ATPase n=1 Tax=Achromobacter phage vB_AxyP_19-32_Axy24 TaxID=2591048 RepID=A0A514CW74_9CAUD|nr:ATPase [Achromobacter phage vB_AxyP_19-32_Axy24]QDH84737.1 hypothetical protein Axy24_030 [Achromobacter phage vB_AxyP_19-32_Axy24]